jgi:hypothetical protein
MKPPLQLATRTIALAVLLASLWWFASDWLAPDGCLDAGGSFNYEKWSCSHTEQSKYMEVSFLDRTSTWVLVVGAPLSLLLWNLSRSSRPK